MKIRKFIKKFSAGILGILLALFMGAGFPAVPVQAAAGTVYGVKPLMPQARAWLMGLCILPASWN